MQLRRITSPILAVTPENSRYVTIARGATIQLVGRISKPGFRSIFSDGRRLLAFNRDVEERSEPLRAQGAPDRAQAKPDGAKAGERRVHCRYPIRLRCAYTSPTGPAAQGKTLNISAGGVLFRSTAPLRPSERIELAIDWPYSSDNSSALQLCVSGKVVRAEGNRFAVSAEHQVFRPVPAPVNTD